MGPAGVQKIYIVFSNKNHGAVSYCSILFINLTWQCWHKLITHRFVLRKLDSVPIRGLGKPWEAVELQGGSKTRDQKDETCFCQRMHFLNKLERWKLYWMISESSENNLYKKSWRNIYNKKTGKNEIVAFKKRGEVIVLIRLSFVLDLRYSKTKN